MSKIGKNIRYLRGTKKWSQERLADELKVTRARIGSYEEDRCDPPVDVLIKLSNVFHVAIDSLIKCDLNTIDPSSMLKVSHNRILFPIVTDTENNDMVEVVTVKASAGYLEGYSDPEYISKLPVMNLPFRVVGKNRAFPIKGDSMPPLRPGAWVIGKFVENVNDLVNGKTYVLVTKEEGVVYKRVFRKNNSSTLELHSDNKEYKPYSVKISDVIELWEFVCALNLSDRKEEEINLESVMSLLRSMQVQIEKVVR
ncbi:MAG TPA: helix-turn-helix domain-containing protein [Bacteroidia bacterium]|jgi:transcriptional regulator with XRE-family HTH domain|nr:helix-turn-helix domain-containing protein [Bacteroidia bacterium]